MNVITRVRSVWIAAASGHEDAARLLLGSGGDARVADAVGYTALHFAAERGLPVLVRELIPRRAPLDARLIKDPPPPPGSFTYSTRGMAGATPLWLAVRAGNLDAVRLLAEAGASPNISSEEGVSPLLQAIPRGRGADASRAHEMVAMLLKAGADATAGDPGGQTPLHAAAAGGAADVVKLLLGAGARVDVKNKRGDTPLSLAERLADKTIANLIRESAR